jgi:hypothetical protein
MIVDTFEFPTLLRSGSLAVVLRQAVRAVIELKGAIVAIGKSRSEAFRDLLVQVGRTKNQLQLGEEVITAMFLFADDISTTDLHAWIGEAIEVRNQWTAKGEQFRDRDALHEVVLPSYIVTSAGLIAEKLVARRAYRFYETDPAVAMTFLVANLLRAVALPPDEDEQPGLLAADLGNEAHSSKLVSAYTDLIEHFGSSTPPHPSVPDLNLTDPPPRMS